MDVNHGGVHIHDPSLTNSIPGIHGKLNVAIESKAGVGNFDEEDYSLGTRFTFAIEVFTRSNQDNVGLRHVEAIHERRTLNGDHRTVAHASGEYHVRPRHRHEMGIALGT